MIITTYNNMKRIIIVLAMLCLVSFSVNGQDLLHRLGDRAKNAFENNIGDKVNDPLSQKRAEAIVAALVEQGIASARLTPVGKGSHVPIASNSTDEGRAKNRRVEFVKK